MNGKRPSVPIAKTIGTVPRPTIRIATPHQPLITVVVVPIEKPRHILPIIIEGLRRQLATVTGNRQRQIIIAVLPRPSAITVGIAIIGKRIIKKKSMQMSMF